MLSYPLLLLFARLLRLHVSRVLALFPSFFSRYNHINLRLIQRLPLDVSTLSIIPFYLAVRFVTLLPHYLCSRTRLGVCIDSLLPRLFIAATVWGLSLELPPPLRLIRRFLSAK